mgnify:CR=1 FL=1
MKLSILLGGRVLYHADLTPGLTWAYLGDSLGVHRGAGQDLRITNGVVGENVGHLYFDQIRVEYDTPAYIEDRYGWAYSNESRVLLIGTGGPQLFPVRGNLIIRASPYTSYSLRSDAGWHKLSVPFPAVLAGRAHWRVERLRTAKRTGIADRDGARSHEGALGIWHPLGDPLANLGGGSLMEPTPGWEQDPEWLVPFADGVGERTQLDCFDLKGNVTQVASFGYTLERYWDRSGQLEAFAYISDAGKATPRLLNEWMDVSYEHALCGYDFYTGFRPANGQHLIRALAPLHAVNDSLSSITLECVSNDAAMAYQHLPSVAVGEGSAFYGRREAAWVMLAADIPQLLSRQVDCVQPNGHGMRCSSDVSWGFIPDPWTLQGAIGDPVSSLIDVAQTMETWYTALVLAARGEKQRAFSMLSKNLLNQGRYRGFPSRIGYIPKYAGVGDLHGASHRRCMYYCGPQDYFAWLAMGVLCLLAEELYPERLDECVAAAVKIPTPTNGRAVSPTQLYAKLIAEVPTNSDANWRGGSQVVPMLSVLSRYLSEGNH